MSEPEPDFNSYSLPSLLDAQAHIDRDLYPERAARIDELVAEKRRTLPPPRALPAPAFDPQVPTSPLAPPPALAWFVLVWQSYCGLGGILIFLFTVSGGYARWVATLPGGMQRMIPNPSLPVLLLALTQQVIALVAALTLFFQYRIAPRLFALALALQVAHSLAALVLLTHSGFAGFVIMLAGLSGCAVAVLQIVYSTRLRRAGWLCKGAA